MTTILAPGVDEVLGLHSELGPHEVEGLPHVLLELLETTRANAPLVTGEGLKHDVRVEHLESGPEIAARPLAIDLSERGDQGLRHRPPSSPSSVGAANRERRAEPPGRRGRWLPAAVRAGRSPASRVPRGATSPRLLLQRPTDRPRAEQPIGAAISLAAPVRIQPQEPICFGPKLSQIVPREREQR
jgi:hypothetical protein